jgi:hypothetical protein
MCWRKKVYTILLIRNVFPVGTIVELFDDYQRNLSLSRCDRILWKTTIVPPEPVAEDLDNPEFQLRSRNRVGQFFVNAFRPPSARVTWDNNTPLSPDVFSGDKTSINQLPPPQGLSVPPTTMNHHAPCKFVIIRAHLNSDDSPKIYL